MYYYTRDVAHLLLQYFLEEHTHCALATEKDTITCVGGMMATPIYAII
jgi:hypothetical protein